MSGTTEDYTVLVVDDEPDYPGLVAERLEAEDPRLTVKTGSSIEDGLEIIESDSIDCVISDYDFPVGDGIEFLREVRSVDENLPFLLLTGRGSEGIASEAIGAGVTDYFKKRQFPEQYPVLANRVVNAATTYRRELELERRRQELETYEHMLHSMLESAALYDESYRFTFVNQNLADWYGRPREELLGKRSSLIPKVRENRDGDPFEELWNGTREKVTGTLEGEFPNQGEAVLEFNFSPVEIEGEVEALLGVTRDVTKRHRNKQELQRAFEEYQELFNGMNDTAWVLSEDGEILSVNEAAVETLGYSREELRSMSPANFDPTMTAEDVQALIDRLPDDQTQVFETVHETAAGQEIPVEISSSLVTYQGEPAVLSIGRDISARKKRERRLEEFASVVSHDLRNPLNVAQGRLEMLKEEVESDHLGEIEAAHSQMEDLIDDLLTSAGETDPIAKTSVDLQGIVERAWAGVETEAATLDVEVDRTVRADEDQLRRLFENLLRNAVEHVGEDVHVRIGELPKGFYLEDDGPGIPDGDRQAVFDSGFSTAADGTGFGLSILRQITEAHDWSVEIRDGELGGTRFEITGVEFLDSGG